MAITYFALTSADPDNCELDDAAAVKVFGQVRLWVIGTPPTSTTKWVVVGEDLAVGDHAGFRTMKVPEKNQLVAAVTAGMGLHGAALADYGRALGKGFHIDVQMSQAFVDGI